MRTYRNGVAISTLTCIIFLLASVFASSCSRITYEVSSLLVSIFSGVFASSLLVLVSSLTGFIVLRSSASRDMLFLIYKAKKKRKLIIYIAKHFESEFGRVMIPNNLIPKVSRVIDSFSRVLYSILRNDNVSWFDLDSQRRVPKFFRRTLLDKECNFFTYCKRLLNLSEETYALSSVVPYLDGNSLLENKTLFHDSLITLIENMQPDRPFFTAIEEYQEKLQIMQKSRNSVYCYNEFVDIP